MNKASLLLSLIGITSSPALLAQKATFQQPALLKADGESILVSDPGYAAPSFADANGDGRSDLIVGQFAEGRIQIFDRNADGTLAKGRWLMVEQKIATVPDIW